MLSITTCQLQGRREYQEDRWVVETNLAKCAHLTLCVVCDGHGGTECSTFLVRQYPLHLAKEIQQQQEQAASIKRASFTRLLGIALEKCIQDWDKYCFGDDYGTIVDDKSKKAFFDKIDLVKYHKDGKIAGSTLVAMLINTRNSKAYLIHIGDSRCAYLLGNTIAQTIDDNVKIRTKEQRPGFEFDVEDGRLQGDLSMESAVGDNTVELYGVVKRNYHVQKIKFAKKAFRAVIASDGLFDVLNNQQALYEPYPHADAIAKKANDVMVDLREEHELAQGNTEWKRESYTPVFADNMTVIYVQKKLPESTSEKDPEDAATQPLTVVAPTPVPIVESKKAKKAKNPQKPKDQPALETKTTTVTPESKPEPPPKQPKKRATKKEKTPTVDLQNLMQQLDSVQKGFALLGLQSALPSSTPQGTTVAPAKVVAKTKTTSGTARPKKKTSRVKTSVPRKASRTKKTSSKKPSRAKTSARRPRNLVIHT